MKFTDKPGFAANILAISEIYGKALSPAAIDIYWNALQGYPLADVQRAIERHVNDPASGQFFPKPADLIRHLQPRPEGGGHPGADEAWGLLLRLANNEHETGVLTDEMREAWAACGAILASGDQIGARRCFIEVYQRHVREADQNGAVARWSVTLGTDARLREARLKEAVEARRISLDQVRALLPGPAPASISKVAGLLEGPDASEQDARTAARLRALAALLRSISTGNGPKTAEGRPAETEPHDGRKAA